MNNQLEIGPGDCPLEGDWDTLDASPRVPVTYIANWGYDTLPIFDNRYDLVFSSHTIEHIPWYRTHGAITEVLRILKPGGIFECWTVNFAVIVDAYLHCRLVDDWDCGGLVQHWMQSIAGRVYAYEKHGNPFMWHKALFDRRYLMECMLKAGFNSVGSLDQTRGHDHGSIDMGVWAQK